MNENDIKAFYKFSDYLIKVYLEGDDYKVVSNMPNVHETWGSVWSDNKSGAINRAVERHCTVNNVIFYDHPDFLNMIERD